MTTVTDDSIQENYECLMDGLVDDPNRELANAEALDMQDRIKPPVEVIPRAAGQP